MMGLSVILAGDPISGMTVLGPFDTADDATEWAEANLKGVPWTLANIHSPADM